MSDIHGEGYGASHNWEKIYTNEYPISHRDKFSAYQCKDCKNYFRHFYDIEKDIFKEIENHNIPDICQKKEI